MLRRNQPWPLHWLTLAVVLPLLLLAAVAWWGTQSQLKAAWAEAREEAERLVASQVDRLSRELPPLVRSAPNYSNPPVPGEPSEKDRILDGTDIDSLVALRDDRSAGISPGGLPRQALAALRISAIDRTAQTPSDLKRILVREAPSILSWRGAFDSSGAAEWTHTEEARALARLYSDRARDGLFWRSGGTIWWIRPSPDTIRYILPDDLKKLGIGEVQGLPAWAEVCLQIEDDRALPQPDATPLAFATLPMAPQQKLVVFAHRSLLEAPIRRQQSWSIGVLITSVVSAAFGLAAIHRTLRRERQLNEMKSQFVASVSHELRAPVASIRLMADALEAEKVAPETAKEFHRLIAREGARLSTLVGNVLDHARIEQGRKVWRMESCDLCSLVADTVRVMDPLAQEKGITLKQQLSTVEAVVDADAIQQALVNLLDNAIKFSPQGTTVTTALSIDEERRNWSLSVRDEGPGIPKEEQLRIFERFYRPGNELRRETQGTGIGLSLVKSIAEAHRGTVTVESERGKGSAFTLSGSAGLQGGTLDHSCRSEDRRSREES